MEELVHHRKVKNWFALRICQMVNSQTSSNNEVKFCSRRNCHVGIPTWRKKLE